MNSRERVLATLNHAEPDRIPIDLGSTLVTGIHIKAYREVLDKLGFNHLREDNFFDQITQIALVDNDLLNRFRIDFKGFRGKSPRNSIKRKWEDNNYFYIQDGWGSEYVMPKVKGFFYDRIKFPMNPFNKKTYNSFKFPDHLAKSLIAGMGNEIEKVKIKNKKCAVFGTNGYSIGLLQNLMYTIGFEEALVSIKTNKLLIEKYLDELTRRDIEFYENFLENEGKKIDIITYYDDFGMQESLLISRDDFLNLFKKRYNKIFNMIHKKSKCVKIFFHSDGSIFELIPDFIEMGVDILNPIQVSSKGMDPKKLKKDFGKDLVLWGGLDTQHILPFGNIKEVEIGVKKLIDNLAPGGGFIFGTVHNIEANVPVENIIKMFDTVFEYGKY
jgi:uroporphyrinogen decarboxylase